MWIGHGIVFRQFIYIIKMRSTWREKKNNTELKQSNKRRNVQITDAQKPNWIHRAFNIRYGES